MTIKWQYLVLIVVAVSIIGVGAGYLGASIQGRSTDHTQTPVQKLFEYSQPYQDVDIFEGLTDSDTDRRIECLEAKVKKLEGDRFSFAFGC